MPNLPAPLADTAAIAIIRAVRTGYRASHLLEVEVQAACLRGLRRAWVANNLPEIRNWLDKVALLLADVDGAGNMRELVLSASSVVRGEVEYARQQAAFNLRNEAR